VHQVPDAQNINLSRNYKEIEYFWWHCREAYDYR